MNEKTLRFTKDHEWISFPEGGISKVGISNHAQSELGDIVYIELPEPPTDLTKGDSAATVESVKAASDVYAPVAGIVQEVNEDLEDNPSLLNESPYEQGWLFRLKLEDESEIQSLMDYDSYQAYLEEL